MYKLRVRIHPHNTLEALAHHHVAAVQAKLQANDYRSISHDCTSAVIAMAFTVEAVMNYVGAKKVSSWKERAPFRKKVKLLEERLAWISTQRNSPKPEVPCVGAGHALMVSGRPFHQGMLTGLLNSGLSTTMGRWARRWKWTLTRLSVMVTVAGMSMRSRKMVRDCASA